MEYSENREVNEMEKRHNGQRDIITSSDLFNYLGSDGYQNKAEEMLLDILNNQWPLDDAISEVRVHNENMEEVAGAMLTAVESEEK